MKKYKVIFFLCVATALFQNCGQSKKVLKEKEIVNEVVVAPKASFSYGKDVAPIIKTSCSPCHFPPEGYVLPIDTYSQVKKYTSLLLQRVKLAPNMGDYMPYDRLHPLSDSSIALIETWQKDGSPEF